MPRIPNDEQRREIEKLHKAYYDSMSGPEKLEHAYVLFTYFRKPGEKFKHPLPGCLGYVDHTDRYRKPPTFEELDEHGSDRDFWDY